MSPNKLWLFVFQKPAAVSAAMSADIGYHFLFVSDEGFPLSVGRTEVRPTSLRIAVLTFVAFPADLLKGENPMK